MCGISFTYCNSKINTKTKITIESLYKKISKLLKKKYPKNNLFWIMQLNIKLIVIF